MPSEMSSLCINAPQNGSTKKPSTGIIFVCIGHYKKAGKYESSHPKYVTKGTVHKTKTGIVRQNRTHKYMKQKYQMHLIRGPCWSSSAFLNDDRLLSRLPLPPWMGLMAGTDASRQLGKLVAL